jgi:macrolide phosphotransferase
LLKVFVMTSDPKSTEAAEDSSIRECARRHGLDLVGKLNINELGLDFRVVTASDRDGRSWVLRIPRRGDMIDKIERENRILSLLRPRLPFAVPDWRIVSAELVAYPELPGPTAISVNATTQEVTWNIDEDSAVFVASLGRALAALHAIPAPEAIEGGLRAATPDEMRERVTHDIALVKSAFAIEANLERRWRAWLDDDASWPQHAVVVHGDLYAGHVLVHPRGEVTGMIDWSEAEFSDPSIDFTSHLLLCGEGGLTRLIESYANAGGRTWDQMARHIAERLTLTPLRYALFALETREPVHLDAAKAQLLQG